jgi:hypothetical protein
MDDALGKAGAVAVAFGERVHALVAHVVEEAEIEHAVDGLRAVRAMQAAHFGAEAEEAGHGHVRIERSAFSGR